MRRLAGLAVRGAGKVLPPLGDIYFGQLGAPGCQPKAEGCDKEQASQHPPRAQASEVSLEIGTEGDILDILAGDLCVEAEADGSRGAGSGAETLSETQCWSVPGLSSEDVPADDTQKKTQLLRKEIEQCNALMDAAHRATAVANKVGPVARPPRLGCMRVPKPARSFLSGVSPPRDHCSDGRGRP